MQHNGASIEDSMIITGMQIQSQLRKKGGPQANLNKKSSQKGAAGGEQANTETSFRPNKFGVTNNNKTCESFQNQKTNA